MVLLSGTWTVGGSENPRKKQWVELGNQVCVVSAETMTVREFHSCLRNGKRCSLPSCRPVYFLSILCCVKVVSVSVDAQYGSIQSLCWLVCQQ